MIFKIKGKYYLYVLPFTKVDVRKLCKEHKIFVNGAVKFEKIRIFRWGTLVTGGVRISSGKLIIRGKTASV